MKLARLQTGALARVEGDQLVELAFEGDVAALLRAGIDPAELEPVATHRLDGTTLASPVAPGKVVAIGLNYLDHIREAKMEQPKAPLIFAKFPSSVVGPTDDILVDRSITDSVDWEAELGVVVGRTMRNVPEDQALDHVYGYTVGNDVSARDAQFGDGQWVRGKSLDTFCPVGPWVVTADEIADPQALRLWTEVNGERMQDSSTAEMIFGVAEILAYCSRQFTLDPGDLVLTGTPWGVGVVKEPPITLQDGDLCAVGVESIGELRNRVRNV